MQIILILWFVYMLSCEMSVVSTTSTTKYRSASRSNTQQPSSKYFSVSTCIILILWFVHTLSYRKSKSKLSSYMLVVGVWRWILQTFNYEKRFYDINISMNECISIRNYEPDSILLIFCKYSLLIRGHYVHVTWSLEKHLNVG